MEIINYIKSAEIKFCDNKMISEEINTSDLKIGENQKENKNLELFLSKKEIANELLIKTNYLKAIDAYDETLLSCNGIPENQRAIIFCNKSKCYFEMYIKDKIKENLFSSKHNVKLAISLDPLYIKAYYRLALIYEEANKPIKALNTLNKCLLLEKDNNLVKDKINQLNHFIMEQKLNDHLNPDLNCEDYEAFTESTNLKLKEIFGNTDYVSNITMNYDTLKKLRSDIDNMKTNKMSKNN